MIHGPCGEGFNTKSKCMKDNNNQCCKNFPKPYQKQTEIHEDGYPIYMRRSIE